MLCMIVVVYSMCVYSNIFTILLFCVCCVLQCSMYIFTVLLILYNMYSIYTVILFIYCLHYMMCSHSFCTPHCACVLPSSSPAAAIFSPLCADRVRKWLKTEGFRLQILHFYSQRYASGAEIFTPVTQNSTERSHGWAAAGVRGGLRYRVSVLEPSLPCLLWGVSVSLCVGALSKPFQHINIQYIRACVCFSFSPASLCGFASSPGGQGRSCMWRGEQGCVWVVAGSPALL